MIEHLKALCPGLTAEQAERFETYYALLIEWNKTRNLTAITEPAEVAQKHFFDSLAAAPLLKAGARCIDVGTGAGFPGIPLLIMRPDLQMTLLDALNKRIEFLSFTLERLGLAADCVHLRAEDAGRSEKYRQRFDAALTRAVAPLPVLLEWIMPLGRAGERTYKIRFSLKAQALASFVRVGERSVRHAGLRRPARYRLRGETAHGLQGRCRPEESLPAAPDARERCMAYEGNAAGAAAWDYAA